MSSQTLVKRFQTLLWCWATGVVAVVPGVAVGVAEFQASERALEGVGPGVARRAGDGVLGVSESEGLGVEDLTGDRALGVATGLGVALGAGVVAGAGSDST